MTTAIAPPPAVNALPVSAAGRWTCTIEDGRRPRKVTMTRHQVDETVTLFRADGWNYRLHSVETSDQGDVFVTLIRQTRKGHDYKNGLGISMSLADLAADQTSSPQHLAGIVARIQATVAAPAAPNGPADLTADQLRRGDLIATDRTGGIVAAVVETDAHGFISVRPFDGYGGIAEHPYRYLTSETVHVHRRGLVDGPMVDGRPVGPALTVPMPAAQPGECPDCLAPEGECNAATCPAYASDDAPLSAALLPDAPLGTVRFGEGCEDDPQCPCGNDAQGDGFRYVTVATSVDGPVGVFIEADGAWHALGRHVACVADHCLRVWSDRDIVRDGTGVWAPVTMRLHHVAEPSTA